MRARGKNDTLALLLVLAAGTFIPAWLLKGNPESKTPFFATHSSKQSASKSPSYTTRVLGNWPSLRAYVFEGILSTDECDHIVKMAEPFLARSKVVNSNNGKYVGDLTSEVRTSHGMFLQTPSQMNDPVHRSIRLRLSTATGFPEANMEATQVLRYDVGEFYRAHPDWFNLDKSELALRGGQRCATVLCYLNTPEEGGATRFPEVNVTVPAKKGDCVFFYDVTMGGEGDVHAFHEAMVVTRGVKWSMPIWIREHEFR